MKSFGKPVSKDEVLKELGHPGGWAKLERRVEFQKHLKRDRKQLDIQGLKGYLAYLEESLNKPAGSDTGLVSKRENAKILKKAQEEIGTEIEKHQKRLVRLEKDPIEVAFYINDLARMLETLRSFSWKTAKQILPELIEMEKQAQAENEEKIRGFEEELKKYKALFLELRKKHYQNCEK